MGAVIIPALIGLFSSAVVILINALLFKRKNRADVKKVDAEADDLVTRATDRLIKLYEDHDKTVQARLNKAEVRADRSEAAEQACRATLILMQNQIDSLRIQVRGV